jgi:hypothetical protein
MNPRLIALAVVVLLGVAVVLTVSAAPDAKSLGPTPVVVELFTSQGCSSCPPADALLRTFANDPQLRGKVIPLAFHVDYWDRLGWRDPFSSRAATQRQMAYVRSLHVNSAYTPQVVVNGAREMVGSNANAVGSAIEAASKQPVASSLRITTSRAADSINVAVRGDVAQSGLELIVALYEDDVTTNVGAGENGGRTLVNDGIVRQFVRVDAPRGAIDKTLTIRTQPGWRAEKLGVAAFLQDVTTMRIGAAASAR